MKQKKIIKSTGGFLTNKDVTVFKDQQKNKSPCQRIPKITKTIEKYKG